MSYRDLATRPVLTWALVAVGARAPVAMAPLAVVFMVRDRPGGYTLGAVLAAAYVLGEIVGAPLLGMRLRAERARPHLAAGLAGGAVGFAALGLAHDAHPVVLGAAAFVAGAAPAATSGGLRAMLASLVPEKAVQQAVSGESMLIFGIWSVTPAVTTWLALSVRPYLPMLLAAGLMAAAVAGLWALPPGWKADTADRGGEPMRRVLWRAWPVYVTGAAGISLLALAELVLPALLEQRGIALGWAGPLLAGFSAGSAAGAFVYGLRSWPGALRAQSLVLLLAVSGCVALVALLPGAVWLAVFLVLAGVLQAGAMLTRNLLLREVLPPSALTAGYSVMYAAVGAGYAVTGTLSGVLLRSVAPSTAILAGVGLTLLLTVVGVLREPTRDRSAARGLGSGGAEGAPVDGRRDPERSL
ncbi:MFS transporter [Streptomyces sp. BPTC-684]|uniref:MFS transporter n=1 Tax=Streptomyces sp. BPTC-684 TaxID=3043734 RepID=UPI0024B1147E|nr:MFS transporter [Streptomyces sp. BPTC-684]WHM38182.1 MFS transporter [Streptomyces sp. BPTC-684]